MKQLFILLCLCGFMSAQTHITAGNINNVLYADQYAGSDIGAKVNAAYASASCPSTGCHIKIPSGTYSFSTPIVCGTNAKPCGLEGDPARMTKLVFTPGTGTAITLDWGSGHLYGAGVDSIYLAGACTTNACSGVTAVGIQLASSNGADGSTIRHSGIGQNGAGFAVGVKFAGAGNSSSAFISSIDNTAILGNAVGVGVVQGTENISIYSSCLCQNGIGLSASSSGSNSDIYIYANSFDDNTTVALKTTIPISLWGYGNHFENSGGGTPFYIDFSSCSSTCRLFLDGGQMLDDNNGAATVADFISFAGDQITISQVTFFSQSDTITQAVLLAGGMTAQLFPVNISPSLITDYNTAFTNGRILYIPMRNDSSTATAKFFNYAINTNAQITSSLSTGTAPFSIASTTAVANLTASNHPLIYIAGVQTASEKVYVDVYTLSGGTVTFTFANSFAFGSTSFRCLAQDTSGTPAATSIGTKTTTSVVITGTSNNPGNIVCWGT